MLNSMLEIGSIFYIEYLIFTHILVLAIEGCQFFRNCMCDATHISSFGSGRTAINELHKCIYYIVDDIFAVLYRRLSGFCIKDLTGYENMTR